ncbi:MAG: hypothetical protein IJZ83_01055 [Clostridia bacterium]|nr:hypothetical protein [Clostridia bacterium]
MIKFGWAETDITPKQKISLEGEFFERVTDDVETPITVTALAIEAGGEQIIICSCDLVCVTEELVENVRERINTADINKSKIILTSVHIHNSYTYRRKSPLKKEFSQSLDIMKKYMPEDCEYVPQVKSNDCMNPDDAFEYLAEVIAKTVEVAWKKRSTGGYATGFGRAAIGLNRRVCYSDGTAKMWGDVDTATFTTLEAGTDSGIELVFVYDENKKMTGIVANVACPAQVMEQRSVISSDYWGKVKILLREKYGQDLMLLPICSAAGDLCPRDMVRWVEPETSIKDPNIVRNEPKFRKADPSMFDIKGTWKIGRRIFNEIEMAIEEIYEINQDAEFRHCSKVLSLPLRKVTDSEKVKSENRMREFLKGRKTLDYMDSAEMFVHAGTIQRYELQQVCNTVDAEIHAIRLGNIAFVTNSFELFHDYGNQIRARSVAEQTFIAQLSNGDLGYLPTEKAQKGGHYSAYVSSGYVGYESGELLVSATLDMINDLFE